MQSLFDRHDSACAWQFASEHAVHGSGGAVVLEELVVDSVSVPVPVPVPVPVAVSVSVSVSVSPVVVVESLELSELPVLVESLSVVVDDPSPAVLSEPELSLEEPSVVVVDVDVVSVVDSVPSSVVLVVASVCDSASSVVLLDEVVSGGNVVDEGDVELDVLDSSSSSGPHAVRLATRTKLENSHRRASSDMKSL